MAGWMRQTTRLIRFPGILCACWLDARCQMSNDRSRQSVRNSWKAYHQVDDRGEQELFGVLFVGDVFEELVDHLGVESVLQDASRHNRQRGILGKPLKDVAEDHSRRLPGGMVTPCLAIA